jgi:hypothetical protein
MVLQWTNDRAFQLNVWMLTSDAQNHYHKFFKHRSGILFVSIGSVPEKKSAVIPKY